MATSFYSFPVTRLDRRRSVMATRRERLTRFSRISADLLRDFAINSKIHGVCHIPDKKFGSVKNAFWCCMTVFGLVMIAIHIYYHAKNFLTSPITVNYKHGGAVFQFPDVTLCSLSSTNKIMYSRTLSPSFYGIEANSVVYLGLLYNASFLNQMKHMDPDVDLGVHRDVIIRQRASYPSHTQSYYPYNELVFSCQYMGKPCDPKDFYLLTDPHFWNCYIFRPKVRVMQTTDPDYGLSMTIYTNSISYEAFMAEQARGVGDKVLDHRSLLKKQSPHFSTGQFYDQSLRKEDEPSGVRITVHERETYPHSSAQGFMIPNGQYAKVGLEMISESKMLGAGEVCVAEPERFEVKSKWNKNEKQWILNTYSMRPQVCEDLTFQNILSSRCGCRSFYLPSYANDSAPYCRNYTGLVNRIYNIDGMTQQDVDGWIKGNRMTKKEFRSLYHYGRQRIKNPVAKKMVAKHFSLEKCETEQLLNQSNVEGERCKFLVPCQSEHYKYALSNAPWPRPIDLARLIDATILPNLRNSTTGRFQELSHMLFNIPSSNHSNWSTNEDLIRANFAKVVLHPLNLRSEIHMEEYTYSYWEALSELGGIMGLWMGMSLISLFEIVSLAVSLCCTPDPRAGFRSGRRFSGPPRFHPCFYQTPPSQHEVACSKRDPEIFKFSHLKVPVHNS